MATTTSKATGKAKTSKGKATTPKAPGGTCGLSLRINGEPYRVRPIPADFGGLRAFRLTKRDGEFHDVTQDIHGNGCTCGDFVWRRDGIDPAGCKHIRAARAVGLIG